MRGILEQKRRAARKLQRLEPPPDVSEVPSDRRRLRDEPDDAPALSAPAQQVAGLADVPDEPGPGLPPLFEPPGIIFGRGRGVRIRERERLATQRISACRGGEGHGCNTPHGAGKPLWRQVVPRHRRVQDRLGPGYRICIAKDVKTVIIQLGGGTKKRQQKDIERALELRKWYK